MYDILIKNGRALDPSIGLDKTCNLGIADGVIRDIGDIDGEAALVVDAKGRYVTPGLVDFHAHVYFRGTDWCMPVDTPCLTSGVTAVVDGGSVGAENFELFHDTIAAASIADVYSFLHVGSLGQPTHRYPENVDPALFQPNRIAYLAEKYKGTIKGLKLRQSREIVGELGLEPLKAAVAIGEKVGLPLSVHISNSPGTVRETLDILRPGDIFCHVFHQRGNTIIGDDGKVLPEVFKARERGVLFEIAHGSMQFSGKIAKAALDQGFIPDIVSTDLSLLSLGKPPTYSFSYIMTELLNLGMSFSDIVERSTVLPSKLLGREYEGFLRKGGAADIALFSIEDRPVFFKDRYGNEYPGDKLVKPEMTIKDGKIYFRQYDFFN